MEYQVQQQDIEFLLDHVFDVQSVWSEIEAFADLSPDVVKAIFESDYPAMGSVADLVALIERSPFELLDHFPLPPEAW